MFLQMSHGELLEVGSTFKTCYRMLGNAFSPVDSFWWCLWCYTCNATMSVFLRFQCLQTGIGVLEGGVHLLWCESVRFNLCKNEVFRHFEQGLGHGTFLGMEVRRRTRLDIVMNAAAPKVLLFSFPIARFSFVNFVWLSALSPIPSWRFSPADSPCRIVH